jgi:hypothetical protein
MSKTTIHEKLDNMLSDKKTRNFLNHLVRAYIPVNKVEKVFDTPKGIFKCVLTNEELFSMQEVLEGIHTEEFKENFMTHLRSMFEEGNSEHPLVKLIGDKKMGITGKDTTTYMSPQSFQEFYDWVITKAMIGDKHINWLLGDVRRETFMKRAESINDSGVQQKLIKNKTVKEKRATYTIGDASNALLELKKKLENEN